MQFHVFKNPPPDHTLGRMNTLHMIMIMFIYCNFFSARCQLSVDLYKNRLRDSTKGEKIHKTIQKHKIHKIENKNTNKKTNIKILQDRESIN